LDGAGPPPYHPAPQSRRSPAAGAPRGLTLRKPSRHSIACTSTERPMEISEIQVDGYERVSRCRDPRSGLHALIAIHDTTLGPALGGMRMLPYASEDDALFDVLRLAKGMTYKSAIADTGLGGGKSVIIGDPTKKTPELFR